MAAKFKDTEKKKMFFSVCDFFFLFKIEYSIPFLISKKKKHKIEEVSTVVLIFIEII